jgi:hypothetical protein
LKSSLKKWRSCKFPKCTTLEDFDNLLLNHDAVKEKLGFFRGDSFYRGVLSDEMNRTQAVFVNQKILNRIEDGFLMSVDGTYGILPFPDIFSQLLVAMAKVEGRVSL